MNNKKNSGKYKYDFGMSFSGKTRTEVEAIVKILKDNNYSVFYDNDLNHELLGKDLYRYLRDIYHYQCKFVVCYLCEDYVNTAWPMLEMTAIKECLMDTLFNSDFLLPINMEKDRKCIDIPSFIGFYNYTNPQDIAKLLMDKFNSNLNEDLFMENTANFLEYVKTELTNEFNKNGFIANRNNEILTVSKNRREASIFLIEDRTLFTPCLKFYINKNIDVESNLPDLILTWNKEHGLYFSIYNLNVRHSSFLKRITLRDIMTELFKIIKSWDY